MEPVQTPDPSRLSDEDDDEGDEDGGGGDDEDDDADIYGSRREDGDDHLGGDTAGGEGAAGTSTAPAEGGEQQEAPADPPQGHQATAGSPTTELGAQVDFFKDCAKSANIPVSAGTAASPRASVEDGGDARDPTADSSANHKPNSVSPETARAPHPEAQVEVLMDRVKSTKTQASAAANVVKATSTPPKPKMTPSLPTVTPPTPPPKPFPPPPKACQTSRQSPMSSVKSAKSASSVPAEELKLTAKALLKKRSAELIEKIQPRFSDKSKQQEKGGWH